MLLPDYNYINPNLPENDIVLAAVGKKYPEIISALNGLNIQCVEVKNNPDLPEYLNGHADLSMFHYSKNILFSGQKSKITKMEQLFHYEITGESCGKTYPDDCRLNCVRIGNNLICNENIISKNILNNAYKDGLNIINVNQGYSKCSVCVIDETAIITDDISIYKSAQNFLNDILLIEKGSIRLKGTNYGFIGGCTGKIGKEKVAFTGRIESHSNHNDILDFLCKHNIIGIELTNEEMYDIGSIIPLLERKA